MSAKEMQGQEQVGVTRELLKEILREVVQEEGQPTARILQDVEPGTKPRKRDQDLAQRFLEEVTNRPKRAETVNLTGAVKKLESAEKVLEFMNPQLEGKSRAWGRNPKSRKEALALANHCVKEALALLRVKAKASLN